jgi:hypothetical protein
MSDASGKNREVNAYSGGAEDECLEGEGGNAGSGAEGTPRGWGVLGLLALVGVLVLIFGRKPKPRAFISFAFEDAWARDFLVRQSQFGKTPWSIKDGSLRVPFDERTWKSQVRPMIDGADIFILMIGRDTWRARGATWEIECAQALGIPIVGIHIYRNRFERGRIPHRMRGEEIIDWRFDDIQEVLKEVG